jgi:hypothetical protein
MAWIRPRLRRPSAPMIVALLALFVALGGPARAAKLVNGAKIKPDTIGSKQIKDRSLKVRDLGPGAVRALTATPNGSIGAAQLAENAVTTRALAPDSVITGTVGDNSLTSADLATNAAGSDEVADNAVGQSEIRNNGVSASEIADNSIDGGEIVDGGLSIRDIAREVGTMNWPIDPIDGGKCGPPTGVPITTIPIAGDFLVVSPVTTWPLDLVYVVNGTGAEDGFKMQACNRSTVRLPAAPTTYTFNYAVLGF